MKKLWWFLCWVSTCLAFHHYQYEGLIHHGGRERHGASRAFRQQFRSSERLVHGSGNLLSSGNNLAVNSVPWPVKREAVVEGDLVIGGLMMVHEREDSVTCGPIMPQGGIQALEAMLYTVDRVNKKRHFLQGFKLGAHILDDCDKDTYGLEMAVDFIKAVRARPQSSELVTTVDTGPDEEGSCGPPHMVWLPSWFETIQQKNGIFIT
ncbi:hypothetical protein B566_EDAN015194 [Ephemera danica]|nr:hypothetical protein B566_EDAN015194 [Ephemera danica]